MTARALGQGDSGHRAIPARELEVAVLDRTRFQERKFRRLGGPALEAILGDAAALPDATSEPGGSRRRRSRTCPREPPVGEDGDEPPVAP